MFSSPSSMWAEPSWADGLLALSVAVLTLDPDNVHWIADDDVVTAQGYPAYDATGQVYALLNADVLPGGYTSFTNIAITPTAVMAY